MLVGPISSATTFAATTTQVAQTAPQATGAVNGVIKDNTGAPVAGATVRLEGKTTYSTLSDDKGAFSVVNVGAGFYTVTVMKAGYQTARESQFAVFTGETETLAVELHVATLTSLRTIAHITSRASNSMNTSTAAITNISSQTFTDQGTPQVTRVLNQIPGVQISLPQTSANGAVPGAITFPNIRGSLSFETATLIDGHPLSVGTYGDYVTTFLNAYALGGVEVIKGPGAMSPEVNYAIGGTVNFRTKDPTFTPDAQFVIGAGNRGGTLSNFLLSDTVGNGRLGFVVDIANTNEPSALNGYQANYSPVNGFANWNGTTGTKLGYNNSYNTIPGTASTYFNQYSLYACCYTVNGNYNSTSELLKLRYRLSNATSVTASYLGGQSFADQNGNTSSQVLGFFAPGAAYTGTVAPNSGLTVTSIHPGGTDQEINNEPIFQAEVRSTLGNDTVLGRFYHASIDRLIYQGNANAALPTVVNTNLQGTNGAAPFAGSTPVAFFDHYNQTEIDRLAGLSFEYSHPIHDNLLTFSVDSTNSQTISYSQGAFGSTKGGVTTGILASPSVTIPTGASQVFTTYLARGQFQINPKLSATVSLYDNLYKSTYAVACPAGKCSIDGSNVTFNTTNTTHFDQRFALEYRPKNNVAIRLSAGSAIAPPYLALLNQVNGSVAYAPGSTFATQTVNSGTLLPETAFGYDLGGDYRFKDGMTVASGDVYSTNLFNHFVAQTYNSGTTCQVGNTVGCPVGTPIFYNSNVNLNQARFQGIELQIKRDPKVGFGYVLAGATQRAYTYNLPANFYCTNPALPCTPANYNTNLAIIPNQNFTGYGLSNFGNSLSYNGFSNQNIPYLQGNMQLSYRLKNGAYASFGETLFGKNNSLNAPPFAIANLSVRYPVSKHFDLQVSGDNVFNQYPGLFPITGGGVPIPLANGTQAGSTLNTLGPAIYRLILSAKVGGNE